MNSIHAYVDTAPVGSAITLDVKKNGTSLQTVSIADGTSTGSQTSLTHSIAANDYLTIDITQVGSSTAGENLYLVFTFNRRKYMYAKLVFTSNTKTGEQVKDIVRLITSATSSTASLSGLEFIDTSNSTVSGRNTGWSLHSSSPAIPSSGTAVSAADSNFTLEAPA